MESEPGIRGRNFWAAALLCGLVLAAYSNSIHADFVFDNHFLIGENRIHALTLRNLFDIVGHTYWWPILSDNLYRPVVTLSYMFNWAVLGNADRPEGYHLINLALHALNTILAYMVGLRLMRSFRKAVLTAAIWSVHPLLTEAVTNIIGRADLIAAGAVLGGFLIYLKSTEAKGRKRMIWLVSLAIVTTIGLFAKESAIMIVGLIALHKFCWPEEVRGAAVMSVMRALVVPIGLFVYLRTEVLASAPPSTLAFVDNPLSGAGFVRAHLTAIGVMARYLFLTVWPAHLSADYSFNQIPLFHWSPMDLAELAVVALCAYGIAKSWNSQRLIFFWGVFAFLTFLPASNLLFPIGTIMGERLMYLPSLGLVACAITGIIALGERVRIPGAAVVLLCAIGAVLMVRTILRNPEWSTQMKISEATVRTSPESFKGHMLLAGELRTQNLDAAIGEADRGLAILAPLPNSANAWEPFRNTARYYLERAHAGDPAKAAGRLARAIAILKAAPVPQPRPDVVILRPGIAECYQLLAKVYLQSGDIGSAFESANNALAADSSSPDAYRVMAAVLNARSELAKAIILLAEGQWITGDRSLTREMVEEYQKGSPGGAACAILPDSNPPRLNMRCEAVRQSYCAGALAAMDLYRKTNQADTAGRLRSQAAFGLGCSFGP